MKSTKNIMALNIADNTNNEKFLKQFSERVNETRKFDVDQLKAFQIYLEELETDLKELKTALNKNEFLKIRKHVFGIEIVTDFMLRLIKKNE